MPMMMQSRMRISFHHIFAEKSGFAPSKFLETQLTHLLANTVGAATETLGRDGQIIGLVLKRVEILSTLRDLVDIVAHHTDGIVDLLKSELVSL